MSGPHVPMTTSAGHFLSMQPAQSGTDPRKEPTKIWYRGDQFLEMYDQMAKFRFACEAIMETFEDKGQTGDADTLIEILDIVERVLK